MKKIAISLLLGISTVILAQEVIAARAQRFNGGVLQTETNLYRVGGFGGFAPGCLERYPLDESGVPSKQIINMEGSIVPDRALAYHATATNGKYVYLIGGYLYNKAYKTTVNPEVFRFTIDATGNLTGRKVLGNFPTSKLSDSAAIVSGKYLLVMGGRSERKCFAAEIADNGALGPWKESVSLPSNMRAYRHVAKVGNRLFVCSFGEPRSDKLYTATLDKDGLPEKWTRSTNMPVAVPEASFMTADGDKLIFFDGVENKIYRATLNEEGELGEWTEVAGVKLPTDSALMYFDVQKLRNGKWIMMNALVKSPRKMLPAILFEVPEGTK